MKGHVAGRAVVDPFCRYLCCRESQNAATEAFSLFRVQD